MGSHSRHSSIRTNLAVGQNHSTNILTSVRIMRENGKKIAFQPNSKREIKPAADPDLFLPLVFRADVDGILHYLHEFPEIVNLKDKINGNVGLHIAASKGYIQIMSLLLSRGTNINIQDIYGNTALHYAVDRGRKEAAQLLINSNAIINIQDFRGNTPLHVAAANNDYENVKILLFHNSDPEVTDFANRKVIDKTSLPSIKILIQKKIDAIHGGDTEHLTQTINWMSFGVGLGVGLGQAMAKQQQFILDQERMRVEENEKRRKRMLQEHNEQNQHAVVLHKQRNPNHALDSPSAPGGRKLLS